MVYDDHKPSVLLVEIQMITLLLKDGKNIHSHTLIINSLVPLR